MQPFVVFPPSAPHIIFSPVKHSENHDIKNRLLTPLIVKSKFTIYTKNFITNRVNVFPPEGILFIGEQYYKILTKGESKSG